MILLSCFAICWPAKYVIITRSLALLLQISAVSLTSIKCTFFHVFVWHCEPHSSCRGPVEDPPSGLAGKKQELKAPDENVQEYISG